MPITGYSNTISVTTLALLDQYPNAAAAYSLRKLRSAYTGSAIRVRRSSDNTEQDIGFVNNVLDTSSLTSFCGSGNGFVTTWYDQSGNNRDATQTTAANQPQIVNSGNVINDSSKSCLNFNGSYKLLFTYQWANQSFDAFCVNKSTSDSFKSFLTEGNSNNGYIGLGCNSSSYSEYFAIFKSGLVNYPFTSVQTRNIRFLVNYYSNSGIVSGGIDAKFRKNNGAEESNNTATGLLSNSNSIIGAGGTGDFWNGNIQEVILYSSNQSSNRTGISTNINTYYGIY